MSRPNTGTPLRKFNPGLFQSDPDVISQFCVRERELELILDVLRGNIDSPSCRQLLIAAPHGLGKTMLLARTAAELRRESGFAEHLLPVRFRGESHGVSDYADFWLETLFHLAGEISAGHPELARETLESHARLSVSPGESALGDQVLARVVETAERIGKRLVLMVENLEQTCANAGAEFREQLQDVLESEPAIMLLATAAGGVETAGEEPRNFFAMFTLVKLEPLAAEECRRLWDSVAGDDASGRGVRPLEILTGANPRLLAMAAAGSRQLPGRPLLEELVALVDERTEYFRGQLEALPKSERRVMVAILDLWQASATGEIAARARMDVRAVSTMLKRLIERGAVAQESPQGRGRRRYIAAEPLHCIWYKLRRGGSSAAEVERLIRFMSEFYSADQTQGARFSSEVWATGLALMAAERAPREVLEVVADIRKRLGQVPPP